MTITTHTADNWTLILTDERNLHGKPWRFKLSVNRDFWEDIFDQIDEASSPKNSTAAYRRDPDFWNHLVSAGADANLALATPDAATRTVELRSPVGDPKSIYDAFTRAHPKRG